MKAVEGKAARRRRRWLPGAGGALALVLLVAFATVWFSAGSSEIPPDSPAPAGSHSSALRDAVPDVSDQIGLAPPGGDSADAEEPEPNRDGAAHPGVVVPVAEIPEELVPSIPVEHDQSTVLVQLDPSASVEELNEALAGADGVQGASITEDDLELGFAELELADGVDAAHALAQLQMVPEVSYAQPNFLYRVADEPEPADTAGAPPSVPVITLEGRGAETEVFKINDPGASRQWMLGSIDAYNAWTTTRTEGSVTVAVIDDGFLVSHQDLKNNIVATYNAVKGGTDVRASFGGHGTHVCGIIAAEANNALGVAGVSYNAGLLPIKAFAETSVGIVASSTSLTKAYKFIRDNKDAYNIRVVNMSLGGPVTEEEISSGNAIDQQDRLLIQAVESAYDEGILTVCSSGNDASTSGAYYCYPCDWIDCALGVIALTDGNPPQRDAYSNYNKAGQTTKDISAPGTSIYSTYTPTNSSYASWSGTSMAAPCVAGVAALVYSVNPGFTAQEVSEALCESATDLGVAGWDEQYGAGEVNAAQAVEYARHGFYLAGGSALFAGETMQLVPSVEEEWEWTSGNTAIATVSPDGVVSGVAPGKTTITVTSASSGRSLSRDITVYEVSLDGADEVQVGLTTPISITIEPDGGLGSSWSFRSSDISVLSVYGLGEGENELLVQGVAPGTAAIELTLSGGSLVRSRTLTVTELDLSRAKASMEGWTYDGSAHAPDVEVRIGDTVVPADVYTVAFQGNRDAGTCTATIKPVRGKSYITGSLTVTCPVAKRKVTLASPSASHVYDGSVLTATDVQVTGDGFVSGEVGGIGAIGSITNVGTVANQIAYTPGSSFKPSNYAITLKPGTLRVTARDISSTNVSGLSGQVYTGTALTPKPKVTYGSHELKQGIDYTLSYQGNVDVGTATVAITGKGNFTGKKTSSFKISAKSLATASVSGVASYQWYTGKAKRPAPTVKLGSATLVKDVDYTVSYAGNRKAGTATITITGKGNYAGTKHTTFTILAKPTWSGATKMPVGSTASYTVKNGSIRVVSGSGVVAASGKTLRAKRAGTATVGLYDAAGRLFAKKAVKVYRLSGYYAVQSAASSKRVLDIRKVSKADGAEAIVYTRNGGKNQRFRFIAKGDGGYAIRCLHSGKYLMPDGASKAAGRAVVQAKANNAASQRWFITVDAKNRLSFTSKLSGKRLDISGSTPKRGNPVVQGARNTAATQKWLLKRR